MNQRFNYFIQCAGSLSLGVLLLVLLSIGKLDHMGIMLSCFAMPFLFFNAWRNYSKAKATSPRLVVNEYAPPADATTLEQIAFYKKFIYMSMLAFPLLSWIVVSDLNALENGTEASVSLWEPVSFLYDQMGYWPAVISIPSLGCTCLLVFIYKIIKLRQVIDFQQKDVVQ